VNMAFASPPSVPPVAEAPHDHQCLPTNVYLCMALPVLHLTTILLRLAYPTSKKCAHVVSLCALLIVAVVIYLVFVLNVSKLTLMHMMVGSMASESAGHFMIKPMIAMPTWGGLFLCFMMIFPNWLVAAVDFPGGTNGKDHIHFHTMDDFVNTAFFNKQHWILHSTLCLIFTSIATSFWPPLRKSSKMQQVRMFIEPAGLVIIAMLLFTHDHSDLHAAKHHALASHPIVATFMCSAAAIQLLTCVAHLSTPTPDGRVPDLTTPPEGGGTPVLRVMRLFTALAFLHLANFLYVDSIMEYLDCREPVLLWAPEGSVIYRGYSAETELSTYLALTIMLAVCTLGTMLVAMPDDASSGEVSSEPEASWRESGEQLLKGNFFGSGKQGVPQAAEEP